MEYVFVALVLFAFLQGIMIFKRKQDVNYITNISKTRELMSYLDRGCIKYIDDKGINILMIACSEEWFRVKRKDVGKESSFIDVAKICIKLGLDVNGKSTRTQSTPLHYAINNKYNTELVEYLVSVGADINVPNINGQTPFYAVCKMGNKTQYEMFIDSIKDINYQDEKGNTILMIAARYGHPFIVHDLLDRGANVHLTTKSGKNAYDIANDYKESHIKQGGYNTATKRDTYGKHNHSINEMVRRLYCAVNDKKFKPSKYKERSAQPDLL